MHTRNTGQRCAAVLTNTGRTDLRHEVSAEGVALTQNAAVVGLGACGPDGVTGFQLRDTQAEDLAQGFARDHFLEPLRCGSGRVLVKLQVDFSELRTHTREAVVPYCAQRKRETTCMLRTGSMSVPLVPDPKPPHSVLMTMMPSLLGHLST